jgi:general transcription factor 3C polypeptide 1
MCDLLLRLPLCIFVKVFNVSFIIPDLELYLMHPIRRHYLVRHLPLRLRNVLIMARRYIYSIHEVMQHLCYVGLVQSGPHHLKEKEQVHFAEENSEHIIISHVKCFTQ